MKIPFLLLMPCIILCVLLQPACKDDENFVCPEDPVTYDADIKSIINASCAYSGCHDGNSPDAPHNYTTYDGMLIVLTNGRFKDRVLDKKNMPSSNDVPSGKPKSLSDSQLALIQCWLDDGFPEN